MKLKIHLSKVVLKNFKPPKVPDQLGAPQCTPVGSHGGSRGGGCTSTVFRLQMHMCSLTFQHCCNDEQNDDSACHTQMKNSNWDAGPNDEQNKNSTCQQQTVTWWTEHISHPSCNIHQASTVDRWARVRVGNLEIGKGEKGKWKREKEIRSRQTNKQVNRNRQINN